MTNTILVAKLMWASALLFFEFLVNPSFGLLGVVMGTVFLDLVTGVIKAKFKKDLVTSEGFRKTVTKLLQYLVPILVLYAGGHLIPEYQVRLQQASGWVMMFIIYIEVTSIFENLYEIDQSSVISRIVYKNALVILKFGLEHNALKEAADKIAEKEKTPEDKTEKHE